METETTERPTTADRGDEAIAPVLEYQRRLRAWTDSVRALQGEESSITRGRMVAFVSAVAIGALAWNYWPALAWLSAAPVAVFLWLVWRHRRLKRRMARGKRAVRYYRRALARMEDKWHGVGADGSDCFAVDHLYAGDLDLFGRGSLFQRMCSAVTRQGERQLARWLGEPASPDEITARHGALRELRDALDLREALGVLEHGVHDRLDPAALSRWAGDEPNAALLDRGRGLLAIALSVPTVGALVAWLAGMTGPLPLCLMLAADLTYLAILREPLKKQLDEIGQALGNLDHLVSVLRILEVERFEHPRLKHIVQRLTSDDVPPSAHIDRLHRKVEQYEGFQRNQMLIPFTLALLLPIHFARSIEKWRRDVGSRIPDWLDALGQLEALASMAGYWYERPWDTLPEMSDKGPLLIARQLGHPLIPRRDCVLNDVQFDATRQLLMVSGSNMSGKSTMLRAVGVNAVLAQAGAPVRAGYLRLSPLAVGTSMRITDSLQSGTSHFYAELRRLKAIVDRADGPIPVLFLLDEILHGTNSTDRRIGAEAVLKRLLAQRAIGLVTTHDLALTAIADQMGDSARNVHFADHFEEGEMVFDYTMQDGVVKKSNALELMRSLGLDV